MSDVRGVLFGKETEVLKKSYNSSLEPWLCFSLQLQKRTLDFYCEPD